MSPRLTQAVISRFRSTKLYSPRSPRAGGARCDPPEACPLIAPGIYWLP